MDYLEYLFAGFAVFWVGLFAYVLMLQFRLRALLREVDRLEERLAEQEEADEQRRTGTPRAPSAPGTPGSTSE